MPNHEPPGPDVVVVGAGPAGLTAAYELSKHDLACTVLEADAQVGGLSRTVERDGWRFDIGGHRFFTKVGAVEAVWDEILTPDEFLVRPRMSRIYYRRRFFDYPLRPLNALRQLGAVEALRCALSYLWVRLRPPRDQSTFEGWVAARFGWRLYRIFFKTYTEKVWGVPADQIQADWAAQRIKNLSLWNAVTSSLRPRGRGTDITSLIEEFRYPTLGPGLMWERCRDIVEERGTKVLLESPVVAIEHRDGRVVAVVADHGGARTRYPADHVVSSMPIDELVRVIDPPPPDDVLRAGEALEHRDFLTVALVVPAACAFPDNWIYVHAPDVRVGRVQNFGAWSPQLVQGDRTCLGLEYFVDEGDDLWSTDDAALVAFATREIESIGLLPPGVVETGYVVRVRKAYPVYDADYSTNVDVVRRWLADAVPNLHAVGRNGMHRYNNQDHSMYTAMLVVENIVEGTTHDVWSVNVEAEYHEEASGRDDAVAVTGTGRSAPVLPAPR
jgi:protoporphyrinogen oxidase